MKRLLIVGAGGHGRVVANTAVLTDEWNEIAFLDDKCEVGTNVHHEFIVIGAIHDAPIFYNDYSHIVVAIGNNDIRLKLINEYLQFGWQLANLIHPTACVDKSVIIGSGSIVLTRAIIEIGSKIGKGVIINMGTIVDHDCIIEDGVHLAPGVTLGGGVKIGNCSWLGVGTSVAPQIIIGKKVVVEAGVGIIMNRV